MSKEIKKVERYPNVYSITLKGGGYVYLKIAIGYSLEEVVSQYKKEIIALNSSLTKNDIELSDYIHVDGEEVMKQMSEVSERKEFLRVENSQLQDGNQLASEDKEYVKIKRYRNKFTSV